MLETAIQMAINFFCIPVKSFYESFFFLPLTFNISRDKLWSEMLKLARSFIKFSFPI